MANILIIGGGVAGLSAGIYAQRNGHHAIICEKNNEIGGNLTGWQRGPYHIDNCIHWLTGTNPATSGYRMWMELGALGNVPIYQPHSLYTCEYHGKTLTLYRSFRHTIHDMLELSPLDRKEIASLSRAVCEMQGYLGIAGKNHDKHLSSLGNIFSFPHLAKYYRLNTGELADLFTHPLLRKFITALMQDKFSALALILVFATFCGDNGGIPSGSSYAMAQRMKQTFLSLGGTVLTNKKATEISLSDCNTNSSRLFFGGSPSACRKAVSVTFSDKTTLAADDIILTIDPRMAFGRLFDIPMPRALEKQYKDKRFFCFSSYHCAFSCDSDVLPFRGGFFLDIPPEYRQRLHSSQMVLREFSHEETFAPSSKSLIQVMIMCHEQDAKYFIQLRKYHRDAYKEKKKELSQLISYLVTNRFPELSDSLELIDMWTPATYKRYVNSEMGSYMSFAMPKNYYPRRLSNRIPGLSNVFLATQWQQSPGGLPIAARVGRDAAYCIVKRHAHEKQQQGAYHVREA